MGRMQDKVVLISGAARGIGAQIARRMASEGAVVFVSDILVEQAAEVAAAITADEGKAESLQLDVTSESSWQTAVDYVVSSAGKLDVLVNNAGLFLAQDFEDVSLQDWQRLVDVNMTSVFLGSKVCAPALRQAGRNSAGSSIVNLSSIAGLVASPLDPLYGMTKGGVTLFTKATAVNFANKGDPIRVNCIHPGVIDTEMGGLFMAAQSKRLGIDDPNEIRTFTEQRHPLGRMGQTSDIANAALYLASDEAAFITGSSLVVDGGLTAQ